MVQTPHKKYMAGDIAALEAAKRDNTRLSIRQSAVKDTRTNGNTSTSMLRMERHTDIGG
jgi:hypothetical protein